MSAEAQADVRLPRRLLPHPASTASALVAPSARKVETGHNPAPNLTYTGVLSDKTYVEARVSGFFGKDHGDPLDASEPRVKQRFSDLDSGAITGGIYSWYDGDSLEDRRLRQALPLRRQLHGRQPRLQVRRPVQRGWPRLHLRLERLHLHLQRRARLRLHPAPVPHWWQGEDDRRLRGRHRACRLSPDPEPRGALRQQQGSVRGVPDPRPARQGDGPEHGGERQPLHLERGFAARRLQLQADRGRQDGAEGARRPLLPRHHHPGVRRRRAFHNATLPVLGDVRRGRQPRRPRAVLGQLQPAHRPELQEPLHRPDHRRLRARALQGPEPRDQLRPQEG